jgi:uncharacterized protein with PQ loop repeat
LQFLSTEKNFIFQGNENFQSRDSSSTFFKETTKLTTEIPAIVVASTSKTLIESTTQTILQKILFSTISSSESGNNSFNKTLYSIAKNITINNSTENLLFNRSNPHFGNETDTFSSAEKMYVIDSKAIDLVPINDLVALMLSGLAATFMIIGGAIPYVPQYIDINRTKSAEGFSLHVCLALCVANILRILFWFGKRFDIVLLIQSIVMIICMILMLEISVRMGKKTVSKNQRKSVWKGDLVSAFWKWNDLTSYLGVLAGFTVVASIITAIFTRFPIYVEALGMVALLCEACLALPQLLRNFRRRSTEGMSIKMVLMWLMGDVGKTLYFVIKRNPAQFWICSSIQITIDILILGQVYFYGKRQRIPTDTDTDLSSSPVKKRKPSL